MLDAAGLTFTKIVASNDLDENLVADLLEQGARIDVWGVGTNLVTSQDQPALGGVYKLVAAQGAGQEMEPRIKISSNPEKITVPGIKQILRGYDAAGMMVGDCLALEGESLPQDEVQTYHPHYAGSRSRIKATRWHSLLSPVVRNGQRCEDSRPSLAAIRERFLGNLRSLPVECQRRANPHLYWVGLSKPLYDLRDRMVTQAALR
jgi:nicotinate phosphoribosyltransferase